MTLKDDPTPAIDNSGDVITPVSGQGGGLADIELIREEVTSRDGGGRNISRGKLVLRRLLRKKLAMFGLFMLVVEILLAFLGPLFSKWGVTSIDFNNLGGSPPGGSHFWGTDRNGHDVFVQTMSGAQKSLFVGLIAAVLSTFIAAVVGSAAGYFGKAVDNALMWFVNMMMIVPAFLILAIISPRLKDNSFLIFTILLAAFQWMLTARVVRGLTYSLREREFVSAAKFMGVPAWRIITRHILPNMASLLIVDVTVNVSATILAETGLSYFGFGVQPPNVSLGTLIGEATSSAAPTYQSWQWLYPGLMLIALVLAVNFVGDGLRDAVDATSTSDGD